MFILIKHSQFLYLSTKTCMSSGSISVNILHLYEACVKEANGYVIMSKLSFSSADGSLSR